MENTEHMTQVSFRIPKSLKEIVEKFVAKDCHVNPSDFFREALREKSGRKLQSCTLNFSSKMGRRLDVNERTPPQRRKEP